jgi:hypothetical protein
MDILQLKKLTLITTLCLALIMSQAGAEYALASDAAQRPVFIELFTSQNCPSCPPADNLLETLSATENVIAVGCHVTYWDNGRPDALANPACTARQKDYVERAKGSKIFTPQMIVNGRRHLIGSRKFEVMQAVIAAQKDQLIPISINRTANGMVQATLPALPYNLHSLEGIMIAYDPKHLIKTSRMQSGFMHYANPVKAIINYGPVSGLKEQRHVLTLPRIAEHTAFIIQNKKTGEIIAAGAL